MLGISKTFTLADGREVTIETGKLAKQADGAAVVKCGNTMLLATVCTKKEAVEGTDFLPLQVEYQEKYAAVGRFPGGFFKREARPSEYEILIARLVDRALRPLFPDDYHADTQVLVTLISGDRNVLPDAFAGLAASSALAVSNIPFNGPISEVRVGRIDGKMVINPTVEDMGKSDIDMIGYMQQAVNIWCPKLDAFTPRSLMFVKNSASTQSMQQDLKYGTFTERMKARVAAGDELWAYIAINPTQPYVNWQLLSDGTEAITSIWQLKMLDITGLLYWAIDYWKVNYWGTSPWTGSGWGDGMLVYSGYNFDLLEPIPTLRLESIRDGIEDYQMLCMLEKKLGRQAVDDIIHRITTSVVTYTKDDDYIHAVRILLGDTLEQAMR